MDWDFITSEEAPIGRVEALGGFWAGSPGGARTAAEPCLAGHGDAAAAISHNHTLQCTFCASGEPGVCWTCAAPVRPETPPGSSSDAASLSSSPPDSPRSPKIPLGLIWIRTGLARSNSVDCGPRPRSALASYRKQSLNSPQPGHRVSFSIAEQVWVTYSDDEYKRGEWPEGMPPEPPPRKKKKKRAEVRVVPPEVATNGHGVVENQLSEHGGAGTSGSWSE